MMMNCDFHVSTIVDKMIKACGEAVLLFSISSPPSTGSRYLNCG